MMAAATVILVVGLREAASILRPFLAALFLSCTPWLTGCAKSSIEIGIMTRAEAYVELDDRLGLLCGTTARCAVLPSIMSGVSEGQGK